MQVNQVGKPYDWQSHPIYRHFFAETGEHIIALHKAKEHEENEAAFSQWEDEQEAKRLAKLTHAQRAEEAKRERWLRRGFDLYGFWGWHKAQSLAKTRSLPMVRCHSRRPQKAASGDSGGSGDDGGSDSDPACWPTLPACLFPAVPFLSSLSHLGLIAGVIGGVK